MAVKIYPHEILRYFDSKLQYLAVPISIKDSEELLKWVELDAYNEVLKRFGETHCLILLEFFEKYEEFSTCGEIVAQIKQYNRDYGTEYRTKLKDAGRL